MVPIPDRVLRFGVKPLVFAASLAPAGWLVWAIVTGNLSANPLSDLTNETGIWALRFVCITLAITPLRRISGWNQAIKFRRMLGLFAFFYVTLHLLTWIVFVHYFEVSFMIEDVFKRPFITVGMAAFLILLSLAVTSNRFSISLMSRCWK